MPMVDRELWARVEPWFDQALDLDDRGRRALFARLELEAPELVEPLGRLLDAGDRGAARQFLEAPETEVGSSLAGRSIGPYVLVERLGAGGTGTVWRGRRSDGRFEGEVAIKLLHPSLLDDTVLERFRREGSLLARLNHPGIARLYDAGISSAGQPYLVLELVRGRRLDDHAAAAGFGVAERLRLFLQACDAVAYAHSQLVVHRDLKPSNLLVDGNGSAKLLDFGIGAVLESPSGAAAARTVTQGGLTPAYAAPEQLQGGAISTATDVHALGVVLYELLTGTHPFAHEALSTADLVHAIVSVEPPRMSARAANPRGLAGDLDTIVSKALRKSPAERYGSVSELADDLRRHLADQPVRARPDGVGYRLRKLVARRKLETAAAAVAALALLAATAISWRQARASAAERDQALAALRYAEAANDLSGFLLAEANPEGEPLSKSDLLSRAEGMIEARYADRPELAAHSLLVLSDRYYEASDYAGWRKVHERADALARRTADPRLKAVAACELATALTDAEPERARALFAEADRELAPAGIDDSAAPELARCRVAAAISANQRGDFAGAVAAAEEALALEARSLDPSIRGENALNSLGLALPQLGRHEEANRAFERLFARLDAEQRSRTRSAVVFRHNWALSLSQAGQMRRALAEEEQVVALARTVGARRPSPYMLSSLAYFRSLAGRQAEAIAAAEEALAAASRAKGAQVSFWVHGAAVRVYALAGRADDAERLLVGLDRALESFAAAPAYFAGTRDVFHAMAKVEEQGGASEAWAMARRALDLLEREKRPESEILQASLVAVRALNDLGHGAESAALAARVLAMSRAGLGGFRHSRNLGLAELEAARAALLAGDTAAARDGFARAVESLRDAVGPDGPDTLRAVRLAASSGA